EKDPASKKRIPYVNSDYSHLLFNELGNEYDSKTIRHILKLTTVHKLTYKLTDQAINDPKDVYNFILTH
ncbi:capsular polysaccharide synthesis protein, partial [Lactobacillus delbrueckii]